METKETNFRAKLTLLKNPSQSLKATDIKSNFNDWNVLQSIYDQVSDVITRWSKIRGFRAIAQCQLLFQILRSRERCFGEAVLLTKDIITKRK